MAEREDYKKGESLLERCGAIQKIGVYWYDVEVYSGPRDDCHHEKLIIIGNNEEKIKERTEDDIHNLGSGEVAYYSLLHSIKIDKSEVMERFGLSETKINEILGGKNLELGEIFFFCILKMFLNQKEISIFMARQKRHYEKIQFSS